MARLLANPYRITHKNWDIMKKFAIAEKIANNSRTVIPRDTGTSNPNNLCSLHTVSAGEQG
ncbi:hypothetical protein [Succinimonas sp.]|uniref:hypothetical protein n=1 Tax=Succinimonas sp. TaxID=1936151 RepID=UPI00386CC0AA